MRRHLWYLLPALLWIGCGSKPVPPQTQQQPPQAPPAQAQAFQPSESVPAPPAAPNPMGAPITGSGSADRAEPVATPTAAVTIPRGTRLHVRLAESLDTSRNRSGDRFTATLSEPVRAGSRVVIPAGTVFTGHLTTAHASGRLKGRAVIGLDLDSFRLHGRTYRIDTSATSRASRSHKRRNLALIGGGSGLGALIGGLAGGGKGALIGAGAGAAAGTGGAYATGRKNIRVPAETPLTFTLRRAVTL